ncbi:glycosyltransferase family 4 protein [Acinetobacter pullicarnis]|uniref:glycosyltransferase family 4 protein n=1 Tax=Acinetobacter pullicarnis TaxID=2576829 RepID=UPI00111FFE22|nr:glycosyltransferase family 4 protein [Acinetobacter pullicarnis]
MSEKNTPIKVGLIVDEYFGGANTAFGGYGFLARNYIAKYLSKENIQIDILLGKGSRALVADQYEVDGIDLYRLPRRKWFARQWLKKQNYDIYLSIELTSNYVLENEADKNKKLILWIQDPRPMYEWDEINTVKLFPETSYYNQPIYDLVNKWYQNNRVKFISQGYFLNQKAIDLYRLDSKVNIEYVPNPIDIDSAFDVEHHTKKNMIIFLGRLESVKRGWLFCEIAKRMPDHDFYVLGQTFREESKNSEIMAEYYKIENLHFAGHVDGDEKQAFLRDAKLLVNTSIHEALPISFLEALSYGTLLVSNRNPEDLTSKFGVHVGDVLGDGFDKVDLFVNAINLLIQDETKRQDLAKQARQYIEKYHNVEDFVTKLRSILIEQTKP